MGLLVVETGVECGFEELGFFSRILRVLGLSPASSGKWVFLSEPQ